MDHSQANAKQLSHGSNEHDPEKTLHVDVQPVEPQQEDVPTFSWSEKMKSRIDRFWILEAVSLSLCTGALLGVVGLLDHYNGQPLPQWTSTRTVHLGSHVAKQYTVAITLNAVLSIIATVYKIALGIPVAASLGQLKWVWFGRGQKLADFQAFDSAKGVFGSLLLLWRLRAKRLACLAAVITLGSLALDFAFQSMVTYPLLPRAIDLTASLPVSTYFQNYIPLYNGAHPTQFFKVDPPMVASIYKGVLDFNDTSFVQPSCPSGNCGWNATSPNITTYASLGVCGQCRDATASLKRTCANMTVKSFTFQGNTSIPYEIIVPTCNLTLPNGLVMSGVPTVSYTLMTSGSEIHNSSQFGNLSNPFSILSTIRPTWSWVYANGTITDDMPANLETYAEDGFTLLPAPVGELWTTYLKEATATECALYYCARHYSSEVINGTFQESAIDTYYNDTVGDLSMLDQNYPFFMTNITLEAPKAWALDKKAPRSFIADGASWLATQQQFQHYWDGNVSAIQPYVSVGSPAYSSDIVQTIFQLNDTSVEKTIDNLAQAMTTNIRKTSSDASLGTAYQFVPFVRVAWGWIALPVTLLLIALILLLGTILRTRQQGTQIWKTSSLAAFYHPLTTDGRGFVSRAQDKTHLDKISECVDVRWMHTEKGWRLVPVNDTGSPQKLD